MSMKEDKLFQLQSIMILFMFLFVVFRASQH